MQSDSNIEERFLEAYQTASSLEKPVPPDQMLRLYAYYKQATNNSIIYKAFDSTNLVNAFKVNAWLQIRGMSADEAKVAYIELVEQIKKDQNL